MTKETNKKLYRVLYNRVSHISSVYNRKSSHFCDFSKYYIEDMNGYHIEGITAKSIAEIKALGLIYVDINCYAQRLFSDLIHFENRIMGDHDLMKDFIDSLEPYHDFNSHLKDPVKGECLISHVWEMGKLYQELKRMDANFDDPIGEPVELKGL